MCGKASAKYRCPACNLRTCSLACVRAHKSEFECSGIATSTYKPLEELDTRTLNEGEFSLVFLKLYNFNIRLYVLHLKLSIYFYVCSQIFDFWKTLTAVWLARELFVETTFDGVPPPRTFHVAVLAGGGGISVSCAVNTSNLISITILQTHRQLLETAPLEIKMFLHCMISGYLFSCFHFNSIYVFVI